MLADKRPVDVYSLGAFSDVKVDKLNSCQFSEKKREDGGTIEYVVKAITGVYFL